MTNQTIKLTMIKRSLKGSIWNIDEKIEKDISYNHYQGLLKLPKGTSKKWTTKEYINHQLKFMINKMVLNSGRSEVIYHFEFV